MKIKRWLGIALMIIGGIGLAYIVAMALYLYLPNTEVKVAVGLVMLGVGAFLVYHSKVLTNGV